MLTMYQKEFFTLNMLPKNKQNKLGQIKTDRIKEENHLNYTTFSFIKHALFIFHDTNLPKKQKNFVIVFIF